jgi:hypothetical protein
MYTNTKGGWKYRKDVSGKAFYIETVDMEHAKTFIGEIGGGLHTPQEIEDNAKLVATAPKMVEVLKYLNNCGGLGFEKHKFIEDVLKDAGCI